MTRKIAWLAILSMALNTLWPLLALAAPGPQDPTGTKVCTAHGVIAVSDSGLQLAHPGDIAYRLTPHCSFCTLHAGHSPLPSVGAVFPRVECALLQISADYRCTLLPWFLSASLRSRSPPA
jgi:Protein of unknown function (DUF2946)